MDHQRDWIDLMGAPQQALVSYGAAGDANFSSVSLLLHFNGSDASTTFTDQKGHTFTANGNAQIDTAQSQFGGASGLFDGNGDWIDTPDSSDFTLGSGNFTIEFWVRFNSTSGAQYLCGHGTDPTSSGTSFVISKNASNIINGYILNGSTPIGSASAASSVSAGQFYHVAYVRNGTAFTMYLNGTGNAGGSSSSAANDPTDKLSIGRCGTWGLGYFNGWIDDFRFTKGVARYTSNFTPPTAPFPNS